MPEKRLRELKDQLDAVLRDPDPVDAEDRALLQDLVDEIKHRLDDSERDADTLNDRLTQVAARFERTHPRLAYTVQGVLDTLAKLGI